MDVFKEAPKEKKIKKKKVDTEDDKIIQMYE